MHLFGRLQKYDIAEKRWCRYLSIRTYRANAAADGRESLQGGRKSAGKGHVPSTLTAKDTDIKQVDLFGQFVR
jgi:hypothetical protein